MGIEDIPDHYVIMHQFVYQVGKVAGDSHQSYMSPRKIVQELQRLGWQRADHHRPTLDRDGNDDTVVRINQDSVWVKPEHWEHNPELRPPVEPKTPEAKEFLGKIVRGSRIHFGEVKEEIMDPLVQFATGGKVKHWFGHGRGPERAMMIGRLDKQTDDSLPDGTEDHTLIPGPVVMHVARKSTGTPGEEPATLERVRKGLARLGFEQALAHDRAREVWYSRKHWEPAIGGQLGLLPLTPEAEAYEARLSKSPTNSIQRYFPDAGQMSEAEKIITAALNAKAKAPSPEDLAAMRNQPSVASQMSGFAQRGGPGRPKKLPTGDPGPGAPRDPLGPGERGKTAHADTGKRAKAPATSVQFADDDEAPQAQEPARPRGRPSTMTRMQPPAKKAEPPKDDRPTHAVPKKTGNAAWNDLGDEDRSGGLDDDEDEDIEFADDDE